MRIKKGDRGNEVVDIQRRLSALGYDLGPTVVDGAFENKTEEAIKIFQQQHRLPISGVVNTATWRALVDATYTLGDRALYLRSPFFHGHDVFQLQTWLNTLGFHAEPVDGIFGPITERSVREFQANYGLFPDGIVGPSTVAALLSLRRAFDKDKESAFPYQAATPFISSIKGKKIGVGCSHLKERNRLSSEGSYLLNVDLAYRFSNLIELLGAEINLFEPEQGAEPDSDAAIIFLPRDRVGEEDIITLYFGNNQKSGNLAECIAAELTVSLKNSVKKVEIEPSDSLRSHLPQVAVLTNGLTVLKRDTQLKQDTFKQKFAGAIFDGLQKYFENLN